MLSSDVHYINLLVLATTNIVEYWFDNLQNDFFCYSFLAWLLNSISLTKTISIDWNHHCRPIYTNNIESKLVKIKIEESFSSHETLRYSILLFFLAKKNKQTTTEKTQTICIQSENWNFVSHKHNKNGKSMISHTNCLNALSALDWARLSIWLGRTRYLGNK